MHDPKQTHWHFKIEYYFKIKTFLNFWNMPFNLSEDASRMMSNPIWIALKQLELESLSFKWMFSLQYFTNLFVQIKEK